MTSEPGPPLGYREPSLVWCVEYVDPREPNAGSHQIGAFTSEEEAGKLLRRIEADGFFTQLHINMIAVHQSVEDWEWDR